MINSNVQNFSATAFVSCSLQQKDRDFISYVEYILLSHRILPKGTVGRHNAFPENPAISMKGEIDKADFVVIIATARYFQKDLASGRSSYALPEMLQVETGMAYAYNKPVLVFAQEGVNVGNFIPNITQYITLTGRPDDLKKLPIIKKLINNTLQVVKAIIQNKQAQQISNLVKGGLALYGLYKLLEPKEIKGRSRTQVKTVKLRSQSRRPRKSL